MKIEDVTCCVVDHGLYLPLARTLARHYKRVLYHYPCAKAFPTVNDDCIGAGFSDIERITEIWDYLKEIDLFVFPDLLHAKLQQHLRDEGYRVWGSGRGDQLELDRLKFLQELGQTGLPMPKVKAVRGVSELRAELRAAKNKYIKISHHRGTMETWHWRDWKRDHTKLDHLAVKLGPLAELKQFFICDDIPTEIEVGGDTYCVDGRFPRHIMEGYEWKDKGCLAAFKPIEKVAPPVQAVLEAFGPYLERHSYRNYFSAEVRIQDGTGKFIDPCCRAPLPMTHGQSEIYGNLGEILYAGAGGDLVEPEPTARFSCELALTMKVQPGDWALFEAPDRLRDALKIMRCCQADGSLCLPPDESESQEMMLGWLVATGDTPRDTLQKQLDQVDDLPEGVCAATGSLVDLLKEITLAEETGLPFSRFGLPEPAEAVED